MGHGTADGTGTSRAEGAGQNAGLLLKEGQVSDFMDTYEKPSTPEVLQSIYAAISLLVCIGIAAFTGMLHGLDMAVQIFSTSLLVAVPASFFVSISRPMAILETMGCGIVNIATNVAAIPEVIADGKTGYLVEPGDKETLARILLDVSRDAAARIRISEKSFDLISKDFSLEAGARRLEQIYLRLFG